MLSTAERFSPEWWHAMGQHDKDYATSARDESASTAADMETGERHTDHGPVTPPRNKPGDQ